MSGWDSRYDGENLDDDMDACLEWQGTKHSKRGYGLDGRKLAHRAAWERVHGPIPEGMHVLHKCDNPPCVNVRHLFLGTHADNMRDREQKGRANHPYGERSGKAKLTDADVRYIR